MNRLNDRLDKEDEEEEEAKKKAKGRQQKALVKSGTTKVYACDSVETGFDYLIFSESKALTQSIRSALASSGPKFRAELQPDLKPAYYGTGRYVVGIRVLSANKRDPAEPEMACETLRQVLESRAEIRCIEHERLLALVKTLYAQMRDLEESHRQAVPYFGLDDVVVLNDAVALFINDDKLFTIHEPEPEPGSGAGNHNGKIGSGSSTIDVTRAIGRDGSFYPPELSGGNKSKTASLPYTVDARCAYYSFGMLVAYCATLNPALVSSVSERSVSERSVSERSVSESGNAGAEGRRLKLKRDVLGPIEGTKLYWFIVRCCAPDAAGRRMLYV